MTSRSRRSSTRTSSSLEPLSTTRIQRPFHWGLVVLVGDDWTGDYPEVDPVKAVTASERVLLVQVVHAQDLEEFEGEDLKLARAEVVVRRWEGPPTSPSPLQEVYRGQIQLPAGNLTVGDADEWVTVPASAGANHVWVSYDEGASRDDSPSRVWSTWPRHPWRRRQGRWMTPSKPPRTCTTKRHPRRCSTHRRTPLLGQRSHQDCLRLPLCPWDEHQVRWHQAGKPETVPTVPIHT